MNGWGRYIIVMMWVILSAIIVGCDAVGLRQPTPEVTILPYGAMETQAVAQLFSATPPPPTPRPPSPTGNVIAAPTLAPSVTPITPTAAPIFVAQNTAPAIASPTLTVPNCTPRTDWPVYNVQSGDTLFLIAQRFNTDIDTIATASCLANVNLIEVGQPLRVPPNAPSANVDRPASVIFYVIATDGRDGIEVGCGDTAVAVAAGVPPSGNTLTDLQVALQYLLDYRNATAAPGLATALTISGAQLERVSLENGRATIAIDLPLTLVGVCNDARLEAQLLLTIFQFEDINAALITFGGVNLKQQLDLSGASGPDAVYTRADIPNLN